MQQPLLQEGQWSGESVSLVVAVFQINYTISNIQLRNQDLWQISLVATVQRILNEWDAYL